LALETATKRIQDLEARVEALEEEKLRWVRVFREWAKMDEKAVQERARRNKKFIQGLTALIES
jgi:maltooligosyltrehalose synthase